MPTQGPALADRYTQLCFTYYRGWRAAWSQCRRFLVPELGLVSTDRGRLPFHVSVAGQDLSLPVPSSQNIAYGAFVMPPTHTDLWKVRETLIDRYADFLPEKMNCLWRPPLLNDWTTIDSTILHRLHCRHLTLRSLAMALLVTSTVDVVPTVVVSEEVLSVPELITLSEGEGP